MKDVSRCSKCDKYPRVIKSGYIRPYCRGCMREMDRAYYQRNRKEIADRRRIKVKADPSIGRRKMLKQCYNITLEDYDRLLHAQKEVCAICGKKEKGVHQSGRVKCLSVDHCHKTGQIRALLCHACNVAIGLFKDDPERTLNAALYLAKLRPKIIT